MQVGIIQSLIFNKKDVITTEKMLSGKRKQGFGGLQRRVRPRREEEDVEIDQDLSSEPEEMNVEGEDLREDEMEEDDDQEVISLSVLSLTRLYTDAVAVRRSACAKETQHRRFISLVRRSRQSPSLHAGTQQTP